MLWRPVGLFALLALPAAPAQALQAAAVPADQAAAVPAASAPAPAGEAASVPLTAEDFYRIQTVTDPQVSPDGGWVAYVVTTNAREADEAQSAIWLVSWDGAQHLALTAAAAGNGKPRWSPDGRYLAFIGACADDKQRIMLLDRRGGDARPVSGTCGDIGEYAWSPDGGRLALAMDPAQDPPPKLPQPVVIDDRHFKQDEDGYIAAGRRQHLYLVDVADGKLEPLTADTPFEDEYPAWSPDGRRIAFVRTREKGPDPDGRADLETIDARPGAVSRALARPYAPNVQRLTWSPSGTSLAFLQGREPRVSSYMQDRLFMVPAAGGVPRSLTDTLDRAVTSYVFTADGAAILASIEDDGTAYPVRIDLGDGSIARQGRASPQVVSSLAAAGGHTALLVASDHAPDEVHALEDGRLRKLTTHNDDWSTARRWGAVEDLRFRSRDGADIHALLVEPPGYHAGRPYPLLLWIHGGPNGQDQHAFVLDAYEFEHQLMAAQGYLVLRVNYRGSSGRGRAFAEAIVADWGHKEVQDLLAGVDTLVSKHVADPARLAVGGWSYGGILTDYVIASDRRFRAAISGAGSANQLSMFGVDQYVLQYDNELGPPWRKPDLWLKVSYPFFHADRIRTPTLFLGGALDFNVPVAGGEQMYQSLKLLGVPTQLVVYPGQHHVFTRPSFALDLAHRMSAWLDRYAGAP